MYLHLQHYIDLKVRSWRGGKKNKHGRCRVSRGGVNGLRVFTFPLSWKGSSSMTLVISDGDVPGGWIVSQQCTLYGLLADLITLQS